MLEELIERNRLPEIFYAGYSMGDNLVFKMAREFATHPARELQAVFAVRPALLSWLVGFRSVRKI